MTGPAAQSTGVAARLYSLQTDQGGNIYAVSGVEAKRLHLRQLDGGRIVPVWGDTFRHQGELFRIPTVEEW